MGDDWTLVPGGDVKEFVQSGDNLSLQIRKDKQSPSTIS